MTAEIIPDAKLRERNVYLVGDFGGESRVFLNGQACGSLDWAHQYIYLPPFPEESCSFTIQIEIAYHAQDYIRSERMFDRPYPGHQFRMCFLAGMDSRMNSFHLKYQTLFSLLESCQDQERKDSLTRWMYYYLKFINANHRRYEELEAVDEKLSELIREYEDLLPGNTRIYAVGHSHLDLVFKWPWKETVRKIERTSANVFSILNRYDGVFMHSQMILAELLKDKYPTLFEEMQSLVAAGRIEIAGDLWCEFDANMISMESLIQQIILGKRSSQALFGTHSRVCYLPDTFGFPAHMPQILKQAGYDYFLTTKLYWNETKPFPHNLFHWKGIDGSVIDAALPGNSYESGGTIREISQVIDSQRKASDAILLHYGQGDGGGGLSEDMMLNKKFLQEEKFADIADIPLHGYLDDMFRIRDSEYPVVEGELYLETHQGCLTSGAEIKRRHRHLEAKLHNLEFLMGLTGTGDTNELDSLWKRLCFLQFHDALAATVVPEVITEMLVEYRACLEKINTRIGDTLQSHAISGNGYSLINTTSFNQDITVELDLPADRILVDPEGRRVAGQRLSEEQVSLRFSAVPSYGCALYRMKKGAYSGMEKINKKVLENRYIVAEFDSSGNLASLYDKKGRKELLASPGNRAVLYSLAPGYFNSWNLGYDYRQFFETVDQKVTISEVDSGEVFCRLRIERSLHRTKLIQDITLFAHAPILEFSCLIKNVEPDRLLKIEFPLSLRSEYARSDTGCGSIHRSTGNDEKIEAVHHSWTSLSEGDSAVALLSRDNYGISVKDCNLGLSLVKSGVFPDPMQDQDTVESVFRLMVHYNDIPAVVREASLLREGWEITRRTVALSPGSCFYCMGSGLEIKTVKPAREKGALILRILQFTGEEENGALITPLPVLRACVCSLYEEPLEDLPCGSGNIPLHLRPFEMKTVKLFLRDKK